MTVLRYGFVVLHWTHAELWGLDTKTQKVLAKLNSHQNCSNFHRLYLYQRDGGLGLVGVVDSHQQKCTNIAQYVEVSIQL